MCACSEGHAKVNQLHKGALFVSEHDVLGLDVSVHQLLAVHVVHSLGNLAQVQLCLGLLQTHLGLDGVKQVTSSCKLLHHHVRGLGLKGALVSGDDVGMVGQVPAVLELLLEVRAPGVVLVDGLDGHQLASGLVLGNPGGAVGALASLLDERVPLVQASVVGVVRHF